MQSNGLVIAQGLCIDFGETHAEYSANSKHPG